MKKFGITQSGKALGYILCIMGFIFVVLTGVSWGFSDEIFGSDNELKYIQIISGLVVGIVSMLWGSYIQRRFICLSEDKVTINIGMLLSPNVEITYSEIISAKELNNNISLDTAKGIIKIKKIENAKECVDMINKRLK